ncbi:spore coat protein [Clostridiisalibacter paucivorans]|uniref:spore coat protein n=1 Tax=Clostridiisalibacter paucivorans TaxID=408753 RepID=UPI00047E0737|nr:spore coat protein [Clostridiisalibacter paucivorans]
MNEKQIVNDVLSMTKSSMDAYTKAIGCSSNPQLRGALQQLRDEAEQFHYDLYKIAEQKGYYNTAKTINQQDRQQLKSQLSQGNMK